MVRTRLPYQVYAPSYVSPKGIRDSVPVSLAHEVTLQYTDILPERGQGVTLIWIDSLAAEVRARGSAQWQPHGEPGH
jgi:hypothetical protein